MNPSTGPKPLTLGEIAARLNVSRHQLTYAIDTYRIAPAFRVGITRVWAEDDLPRIKAALERIAANRGGRL